MIAGPRESALLIAVPEAEPLVGALRSLHDPSASAGVPAHVTILYPFVRPETIDDAVLEAVRAVVARHDPFGFSLRSVEHFDDGLLYLAPSRSGSFLSLTESLVERFPEHPAYGGAIDVVVPHLTVATHGSVEMEGPLRAGLPFQAVASEVLLMEQDEGGTWAVRERFPLGGGG